MNDKKIITQKEKNYIETLYLYFNIENASLADKKIDDVVRYYNVLGYMTDNMFPNAKYLNEAKGRSWYQFPNYRLGIMDYDKSKKLHYFNCVIQYEHSHLWTLDKNLTGLDLPFDVSRKYYHIQRIDITKVAALATNYMKNYGYISPYRGFMNKNGTIYLGDRKNGNVFRMYDKTKELLETSNFKKIELFSRYFGDIENLYTFELELWRSMLKGSLGIETLADLSKVYSANKNIVSQIRFYKDNDKNKRLVKNNHRDRVPCRVLTDFIEFERVEKKIYKPSIKYAIDQVTKIIDSYLASVEMTNSIDYLNFYIEAMKIRVDHKGKDLVVSFEDTPQSDGMAQMTAKHLLMRDNQTNELELEAERAFTNKGISQISS